MNQEKSNLLSAPTKLARLLSRVRSPAHCAANTSTGSMVGRELCARLFVRLLQHIVALRQIPFNKTAKPFPLDGLNGRLDVAFSIKDLRVPLLEVCQVSVIRRMRYGGDADRLSKQHVEPKQEVVVFVDLLAAHAERMERIAAKESMQPNYLDRLNGSVQNFVHAVEAKSGVPIVVVPDPELNNGGPFGQGNLEVVVRAREILLHAPTNAYFPDGAVRHEVLHVKRCHIDGVPQLVLADCLRDCAGSELLSELADRELARAVE